MFEISQNDNMSRNINSLNIVIYCLAYVRTGNEWNNSHARSDFTRIYMITKGEGYIEYKNKSMPLKPGNIYIIPSGLDFSYHCDEYMEKLYAHIRLPKPNNYDIFNSFPECIILNDKQKEIEDAVSVYMSSEISNIIQLKTFLYNIVSECINEHDLGIIDNYSVMVKNAIDYIEHNIHASLTTEIIANDLFISSSKLQKQFRTETGVSIGKYIDDRLMFLAEKELRKNEKSIKEISDALGYCDQFYFSRKFSSKYGVSPLKYKKHCRI